MKVAYLMNQHPYASCTFIRREIRALEQLGLGIERISIRTPESGFVDEADKSETNRTHYILKQGTSGILLMAASVAIRRPLKFFSAFRVALKLGHKSDRGLFIYLAYLLEACVLLQLAAEKQADHVHAHFGTNAATVAMLCQVLGGPSYSFTVHGPEEFDKPDAIGLPEKIANARFVIAISSFGRSQLCRWCHYSNWSKLHVVRCGVDDSYLAAELSPPPAAPRLVSIGRLTEQKGQMILIDAAKLLVQDNLDLEILLIGDGKLRGELERSIRAHGLEHVIRIMGWQSGEQVRSLIANSRALVLPSFAEGLPVVIMEAFALARPVITTYVAGIPELVQPGMNGSLVPAGDAEALAAAMRKVIAASTDELFQMGRHGRERVLEQHSVHKEAARLADLFRSNV
jgi:colanic acid/amylovoran biosynthesis glycosyltransferase